MSGIDKGNLEMYIERGLSTRQIASEEGCSQLKVRYWLDKFDLKTNHLPFNECEYKCACGETDPENFYGNKKSMCESCHNEHCKSKQRTNKELGIEYLGGRCVVCGYSEYECALDFHHLDPNKKDVSFSCHRSWSWKRLKEELEKCILLCSNCHRAYHGGHINLQGVAQSG